MPDQSAQNPQNIMVIKLGALGDFIQALGPMKAIRAHHPDAKITLLTTKPFKEFAEKSGYFDGIILDDRPKFYQLIAWFNFRKKLNTENFTRVYDLQNNDRTQIYFNLLSPKPEWVGVAKGASHRNTSPERTKGLAFHGHAQTLKLAGIKNIEIDRLNWIKSDLSKFNLPTPYILIVPGSAPSRPEKRWPIRHYINLCQSLIQQGITPVIIGTKDENNVTEAITKACPEAINLGGQTTLFDIAVLARHAKFTVGNDTGPMHMVAPTGCKTIVLFSGHSNPTRHAPLGDNVITIQEDNLEDLEPKKVLNSIL